MPTLTDTQTDRLGDLWEKNESREFDAILALSAALGFDRAQTILAAFAGETPTSPLLDRNAREDDRLLATFQIHTLAQAIRERASAVVVFSPQDIFERFNGPSGDAIVWMDNNASRLEDRMSEHGNQVLDDLLADDGVYLDEDYEGEDEGARTAYESERGGYWYVDEVQGGERYTIAKHLTEDEAAAIANGAKPFDGDTGK